LGTAYFHQPIHFVPVFSKTFFFEVILAGIFFGLCSFLLVEILRWGKNFSEKTNLWMPGRGILGGLFLIGLTLIFSTRYLGLGFDTIQASLQGYPVVWYAFILKMIYTSITLNFGGSGGIVVPIFFVGATAGAFLGNFFGDIGTFSAIGLVSLLAGAANTPIAASILALELFGSEMASYASIACVISFLMTGYRSVHPSQLLAMRKTASIRVEIGKELSQVHPQLQPREKSLLGILQKLTGNAKRRKG
jgi:H+/Cl- antiporter ClcA